VSVLRRSIGASRSGCDVGAPARRGAGLVATVHHDGAILGSVVAIASPWPALDHVAIARLPLGCRAMFTTADRSGPSSLQSYL